MTGKECNVRMNQEVNILYLKGGNYAHGGFSRFLEKLNCNVTTETDEESLLECYQESQLNAFNIFGGEKYHCLIFDVFSASQKSFTAIKRLKSTYAQLPPIIALTTPEQSFKPLDFMGMGFDCVIGFPMSEKDFVLKLNKCLGIEHSSGAHISPSQLLDQEMDTLPVISLKTYSTILSQSGKMGLSLQPLYDTFLEELKDYMKQFITFYETKDRSHYEPVIMAIRGLCATMGASQVYQMASTIESCSGQEQEDQVGALLPFLIEKFLILEEYINTSNKAA
ncbi:MAG: Hpt domain-containing protein [Bacteroidales bacterium]